VSIINLSPGFKPTPRTQPQPKQPSPSNPVGSGFLCILFGRDSVAFLCLFLGTLKPLLLSFLPHFPHFLSKRTFAPIVLWFSAWIASDWLQICALRVWSLDGGLCGDRGAGGSPISCWASAQRAGMVWRSNPAKFHLPAPAVAEAIILFFVVTCHCSSRFFRCQWGFRRKRRQPAADTKQALCLCRPWCSVLSQWWC